MQSFKQPVGRSLKKSGQHTSRRNAAKFTGTQEQAPLMKGKNSHYTREELGELNVLNTTLNWSNTHATRFFELMNKPR